jgi:CDP-glycerol glycerophosphotransferase (TagB/SpsB family)
MKKSITGIYYALRGKYWFYGHFTTDITFWLSGGAVKIDLHHGTPIKKILWDNFNNINRFKKTFLIRFISKITIPWRFQSPDYVLITSSKLENAFISAFQVKKKALLFNGNTRNDILFTIYNGFEVNVDINKFNYLENIKKRYNSKILFYMPTFREKGESPIYSFLKQKELKKFLEDKNAYLIIKEHPWEKKIKIDNYPNERIIFLNKYSDFIPFFRITDVLITDYSSIFIDFLLTKKPIVFIAYDIDNFVRNSRELYFDYKSSTPGYRVYKFNDLLKVISFIFDKGDKLGKVREKVRKEFYKVDTSKASELVYRFVKSIK